MRPKREAWPSPDRHLPLKSNHLENLVSSLPLLALAFKGVKHEVNRSYSLAVIMSNHQFPLTCRLHCTTYASSWATGYVSDSLYRLFVVRRANVFYIQFLDYTTTGCYISVSVVLYFQHRHFKTGSYYRRKINCDTGIISFVFD